MKFRYMELGITWAYIVLILMIVITPLHTIASLQERTIQTVYPEVVLSLEVPMVNVAYDGSPSEVHGYVDRFEYNINEEFVVNLTIESDDDIDVVVLPSTILTIPANVSKTNFTLKISAKEGASAGAKEITIGGTWYIKSDLAVSGVIDSINLHASVAHHYSFNCVVIGSQRKSVSVGTEAQTAEFKISIKNTGNTVDEYKISLADDTLINDGWVVYINNPTVMLMPGEQQEVVIRITPPSDYPSSTYEKNIPIEIRSLEAERKGNDVNYTITLRVKVEPNAIEYYSTLGAIASIIILVIIFIAYMLLRNRMRKQE